jgi:membrane protein YdbS with pleckstrin-like domain
MVDRLRQKVLELLRVPPDPKIPEGTPGTERVFRAGRNFYLLQVVFWATARLSALLGVLFLFLFMSDFWERLHPWAYRLFEVGEAFVVVGILVAIPFTFLALRWEYELRWYIVTDRSLRIRRGVWNVEELTMTFANVQEIRVTSGPVQGYLGLADVEVSSAGGSVSQHDGQTKSHKAVFEGVDNAEEIRDLISERVRIYRDSGLGEQAEVASHQKPPSADALSAARAMLEEAKALRLTLTKTTG